jgi:Domain of unknown function (DUF4360)
MKKVMLLIPVLGLGLLAFAGDAFAQPSSVRIDSVTYSGTGCPAGTVDGAISPDGQQLFLGFDAYVAQTVPGGATLDRKNCQVRVSMEFAPRWTFAISSVDYRGFAGLKAGAFGQQVSTYFFAGQPAIGDARASTRIVGPFFDNYSRRDTVGTLAYSDCRRRYHDLVINTEVRVAGGEGLMTVDSVIQKVQHTYNLVWQPCP